MRQLTIEIKNNQDLALFRALMARLGFRVVQEKQIENSVDISQHLAVIAAGIQRPLSHLQERMQQLEQDREERLMPLR